jgi:type I site-specific restriction endonuclease
MAKLGVRQFHRFMRGSFSESIRKAYESHQIFCEADLQSYAWHAITQFLRRNEEERGKFRVLNKPFLRECKTYPDLVVFRRRKPWAVVELKEGRSLPELRASTERDKLLDARKILDLEPKRGYLVYVARHGNRRALSDRKGAAARYFFEVPIVLSLGMKKPELVDWTKKFRLWSKYVLHKEPPLEAAGRAKTRTPKHNLPQLREKAERIHTKRS